MTATPPLTRRIVLVGVAVVTLVLALVDAFLYLELRAGLHRSLDDLLTARAQIARSEATRVPADALAGRLQELGLRAVVRSPDGTQRRAEPPSPQLGLNLPAAADDETSVSRQVQLAVGGSVTVFARTSGTSKALKRLLVLELLGSVAAVALAALLLYRASRVALRPIEQIAGAAARTAEGGRGERLRPDRPDTELGRMATAYDGMLDALEAALHEARAAQRASSLIAAVVEGSADAIISESTDRTILTWNRAAEQIYGYRAADVIGRPSSIIVPEALRADTDQLLHQVTQGDVVRAQETERLTRAGVRLEVSVAVSPIHDPDGHVVAVSSIARDLTEQRWMATTLNSTLEALQSALTEAQQSEETTRRFLGDAAHQLRTPVAGIRACAEALLRGASAEDHDRLLATMVRETSRAGRLVTSLLQIARLDQGQPLTPSAVDVIAVCADEVDRTDLLAPRLTVGLEVRTSVDSRLLLDGAALREIVSNLLDNARRHASSRITVVVDATVIRVLDDGPGVPVEERERAFERFVSLDGLGGSGLGLPVARGLARAMGGDLRYDAGFLLTLPEHPATRVDASAGADVP